MAIFDYKCTGCDHVEERIRNSDVMEIECEKCGSVSEKQVSAPGYVHGGSYDSVNDRTRRNTIAKNWEIKTGKSIGGH